MGRNGPFGDDRREQYELITAVVIHTRPTYSTTVAWREAGNISSEAEVLMTIDAF